MRILLMQEASLAWRVFLTGNHGLWASSRPGEAGFLVGGALWIGLSCAAGIWFMMAWMKYVEAYRARKSPQLPTPAQLVSRYTRDPSGWLFQSFGASWRLTKIGWEKQDDPYLEQLRRRARRRWWLMLATGVLGVSLPEVMSGVGG